MSVFILPSVSSLQMEWKPGLALASRLLETRFLGGTSPGTPALADDAAVNTGCP